MTELPPTITDDQVSELPLSGARAELVEEILRAAPAARSRGVSPWLAAGAAAAVVAGIALVPTLGAEPAMGPGLAPGPATQPSDPTSAPAPTASVPPVDVPSVEGGRYFALTAPGWTLGDVYEGDGYYEMSWVKGEAELEADSYTADQYDSYFHDRDDSMPGHPGSLLGRPTTTWEYSKDDHATMRTPEAGTFVEFRGSGMSLADFRDLLGSLVQTDADGLAASLGSDAVTPAEAPGKVRELLHGVPVPEGFTADSVRLTGFNSAYQASAQVAGAVGCAWLEAYSQGDRKAALAAFNDSPRWDLFEPMIGRGDYPQVFWAVADQLRSGESPAALGDGIGDCGDSGGLGNEVTSPTYANPTAG